MIIKNLLAAITMTHDGIHIFFAYLVFAVCCCYCCCSLSSFSLPSSFYSRWQLKYPPLVVTANETGVKYLSVLAMVTMIVRDGVIVVGVLVVIIVVIVQFSFNFIVSFCLVPVPFGCAIEP